MLKIAQHVATTRVTETGSRLLQFSSSTAHDDIIYLFLVIVLHRSNAIVLASKNL